MGTFRPHPALTFDDVLLAPRHSTVHPRDVKITSRFTRKIPLHIPLVSAAMDTVTEAEMAMAIARSGGIGVIHKNMPIDRQAAEVDRVKRSESGMIINPITLGPDRPLREAVQLMARFRISAAMDTVTEAEMAMAIAPSGGIGVIHKNMPIDRQAAEVDRVKRSESGMIINPITLGPDRPLREAVQLMARFRISGVPIVDAAGKLVGIITNRDLQFERELDRPIKAALTKEKLVTAPVGTTLDEAERILGKHRIEKLPVVDPQGVLRGLITIKDIFKRRQHPDANKDQHGRLRVAAAVGGSPDAKARAKALLDAGCDVIVDNL